MSLPALYLSHGAPPLLDDETWMGQLRDWSASIEKPKAILIVSAHWENAPVAISSTDANTDVIYDFGGLRQSSLPCVMTPQMPANWVA